MQNQVELYTNYFVFQLEQSKSLFKSSFKIEPPVEGETSQRIFRKAVRQLRDVLKNMLGTYITLNNSIYSTKGLELQDQQQFSAEIELDNITYRISYQDKGLLNTQTQTQEIFQFYSIIMKKALRNLRLQEINRKYFDPQQSIQYQSKKLEIWPGYVQKLVQFGANIYMNIDMSFKIIRQQSALDYFNELHKLYRGNLAQIQSEFSGKTVMTTYNKKMYRIECIDFDKNVNQTFIINHRPNQNQNQNQNPNNNQANPNLNPNQEEITYIDYYRQRYNQNITDNNQPLLKHVDKRTKQEFYLIPELCVMTGLTDQQRRDFQLMKDIAQTTKCSGQQRMNSTKGLIQRLFDINDNRNSQLFQQWNIKVADRPLRLDGHKLDAGKMVMGKNKQLNLEENNTLDRESQSEMFRQLPLNKWAILYHYNDSNAFESFLADFKFQIGQFNYTCNPPAILEVRGNQWEDWRGELEQTPTDCDMVICILQGQKKNGLFYNNIKQYLTLEKGVPCQCIIAKTLAGKGLKSICSKILVQICAKQGGIPWVNSYMPFTDIPTMIIGIDTYHKMIDRQQRSCFAMVASQDKHLSKFWSDYLFQQQGQEISQLVGVLYSRALNQFKQSNGIFPQRIIVFRDGISVGQRSVIKDTEALSLRLVLDQMQLTETKILFLCINKKIDAKFYASQNFEAPKQGTIVDVSVVEGDNDFYLISQKTTQGIPTPSHFHILVNELLSENDENYAQKKKQFNRDVQILSYKLCFQYFNWTGSIKSPSPVQLAHTLSNMAGAVLQRGDCRPLQALGQRSSLFWI